jgi:hypothetical protein
MDKSREECSEIVRKQKQSNPKKIDQYFMGTTAYHQLGDISREKEDLFHASSETDDYYIGSWITGFGFFNVCFPKETSRLLTREEQEEYGKQYIQIGSQPPISLRDVNRNDRVKLTKDDT